MKKLVAVEDRADLLGHGGDTETSERYCEPHEIAGRWFVMSCLRSRLICSRRKLMIPWMAAKQVAPFSQAREG